MFDIRSSYLNLLAVRVISQFKSLEFCFIRLPEVQSALSQASELDLLARIVNSFESALLTTVLLQFHCRWLKGHQ